jgi:circadian clock protein KaiC
MDLADEQPVDAVLKASTGVPGLDKILRGGIPQGRVTLVEGGAGAGKTVLSLQTLFHAARDLREPGIFVAFEESSTRILANASSFGWDLLDLQARQLFFLDAQPDYDLVRSGSFDLGGLLAALDAKVGQMRARRIVFDAIDVVLTMLRDPEAERRELYRLNDWLVARKLTAIITSKAGQTDRSMSSMGFAQFMVDCAVSLERRVVRSVSQRSLRVLKYRGSDFDENEAPYVIGPSGLDVAWLPTPIGGHAAVSSERVATGVPRLDTMLAGGYFRGASILITGAPGTAKTTLCGCFAEAACQRGEPTLYVSFDSDTSEVVRNLGSVGVRLDRYLGEADKPGLLRMNYARALTGSAETHLLKIWAQARQHRARCVVIDPVSALSKAGNEDTAHSVAERLIDWAKAEGITLLCATLLADTYPGMEGSPMQISTLADTWIHLSYLVHGGERNRGLSIIKSRGTAHSNQVRELLISDSGVTVADSYTANGEVLMGTLRWEREQSEQAALHNERLEEEEMRIRLLQEESDLEARLSALKHELDAKHAHLKALSRASNERDQVAAGKRIERLSRRGADTRPTEPRKRFAP